VQKGGEVELYVDMEYIAEQTYDVFSTMSANNNNNSNKANSSFNGSISYFAISRVEGKNVFLLIKNVLQWNFIGCVL
jgi:hypothetical protein